MRVRVANLAICHPCLLSIARLVRYLDEKGHEQTADGKAQADAKAGGVHGRVRVEEHVAAHDATTVPKRDVESQTDSAAGGRREIVGHPRRDSRHGRVDTQTGNDARRVRGS